MVGTLCGIYIAQNYNIPNIRKVANRIEETYRKPKTKITNTNNIKCTHFVTFSKPQKQKIKLHEMKDQSLKVAVIGAGMSGLLTARELKRQGLAVTLFEKNDPREFPGHEEVPRYVEDFARDFGLFELIRFGQEVVRVERVDEVSHEWVIESKSQGSGSVEEEVFEAVVVCNGHHTEPRIAEFPGRWGFIYFF
jgi:NADPH-dependent 2,4-dienoyl-CoA reductase/sulfur reductase-like enzyme